MDFEALTALESKIEEPYVLLWPPGGQDGLASQAYVVMKRKGGLLLAVPPMYLPASVLQQSAAEDDFVFGLHTKLVVPAVQAVSGGGGSPVDVEVLVIDSKQEIAGCLRHSRDVDFEEEDVVTFSDDALMGPDVDILVQYVKEWLELQTDQRATFYSAEEVSEHEEELVPETPKTAKKQPKEPKPKKNTNAALAAQLSEVAGLLPDLVEQVSQLRKNQEVMQQQMSVPQLPVPPRGSQMPVSGQLNSFAKMVGIPPKTKQVNLQSPPSKPAARQMQPGVDTGLTAQEEAEENSPGGDALARAVLEQSRALSVLVAQMQQSDPLLDQAASSAGTSLGSKGALGREKLQQELSSRTGGFYMSVLQNALRRMRPASRLPSTLEEVPPDFSMVTYLERFGGYGGSRDLGLVQFNLAHMFDAALFEDIEGMKEHLALLMVSVEQAVQDNNRWELAYQLCLLEEPPTQVWQSRGGHSHRVRAFAPLCPQRWATVALAYTKEVDYIQTKRQELVKKQVPPVVAPKDQPGPKKKQKFPRAKQGANEEAE